MHGIAARLGFADVRNHLTSERLRRTMGTDLFIFHGYTEIWLDGRWVKATPAFNLSCASAPARMRSSSTAAATRSCSPST